jgi:DNA polymerase III sliding clamp (beta) subunit (PCNA family)
MIFNKNNLLAYEFCSDDNSRPQIASVLFKRDRTIATDSYCLIEIKNNFNFDPADLPLLPDKSKPLVNFAKAGYMIPQKSVKKAMSNLKENKSLPILSNCWFLQPKDQATSVIVSTDLEQADSVVVRNVEGNYPDINSVMPQDDQVKSKMVIDVKYLKRACDVLAKMSLAKNDNIELCFIANDKPLMIKAKTKEDQEVKVLIMPIRQ